MSLLLQTIISGAQTGADRGGLLGAHDLGLKRGGWAPAGWRAEDGVVPEWFRTGMMVSPSSAYNVRTRANVEAGCGTLIPSLGPLPHNSGSLLTASFARRLGKPCLHVELPWGNVGSLRILEWLERHLIRTLNVAGPRESREPGIQVATHEALVALLSGKVAV